MTTRVYFSDVLVFSMSLSSFCLNMTFPLALWLNIHYLNVMFLLDH